MRQRLRARELWLLLPFLLMLAGALYWARAERVSAPGASKMFVSEFQFAPASGRWREKGVTHNITVRIGHRWPRPRWWGQQMNRTTFLDPLHPENAVNSPLQTKRGICTANGAIMTVRGQSQNVVWPLRNRLHGSWPDFIDGEYVFGYNVKARDLPASPQEITFRGIYQIEGNTPVEVAQIIRKPGEKWPIEVDRNPGAQLVSIDALPFHSARSYPAKKPPKSSDTCDIYVVVRSNPNQTGEGVPTSLLIYDQKVRDAKGKIYLDQKPVGFGFGYGGLSEEQEELLRPNEIATRQVVHIDSTVTTSGALTFTGKISVGDRWPIPFQIKLPPRENAYLPNTDFPRWKRPNVAPVR